MSFIKIAQTSLLLIVTLNLAACGSSQPAGQQPAIEVDVDATIAAGIEATKQAEANTQATIDASVAATQAVNQAPSTSTIPPTPIPPTPVLSTPIPPATNPPPQPPDQQQVRDVIHSEMNGAITQDLPLLQSLYTSNAKIVDHKGTPDNLADNTTWQGWPNIERRYLEFFSAGYTTLDLVDLSIQVDGNRATGAHWGAVLDGIVYEDRGLYTLEKIENRWLITQLEYGNKRYDDQAASGVPASLFVLAIGDQHRYEEPWGWDRGDPCHAWETGNFDDTKPNYRGFNVELLLTNNSETKVPDSWPLNFTTNKGQSVKACSYSYSGSGPQPGETSSVTFFTVVEKEDYVKTITLNLEGQIARLCLDGKGGWTSC